jgi:hypothetical protein
MKTAFQSSKENYNFDLQRGMEQKEGLLLGIVYPFTPYIFYD